MNFQKLHITNEQGEQLSARLDLPIDGQPTAYALFAHCFTCSKNLRALNHISRRLTREGFAVLRFDFTGLGESEGDFADTNFSSNVADLIAAADFLADNYEAPQILVGHSLGGAAVLQAAARLPSVQAVATIAAPSNPDHVSHLLRSAREEIEKKGEAEVVLAGRRFTIKKQFLDDLEGRRMEKTIMGLKRPLLIFHGPLDNIVGIDNAAAIFQVAKHPKSFVSLDTADHLLTNPSDAHYVSAVLAAWALKYVTDPRELEPDPETESPEHNRVVVRTGQAHYRTEIRARSGHSLIADEPAKLGGGNLGPNPYDYLMAALGACTSITLRMYADRKEWPVEEIIVRLQHEKVHANDCDDEKRKGSKIDQLEREIDLTGPLDEKQRQRLLQIANKCPVHRTLEGDISILTQLKDY